MTGYDPMEELGASLETIGEAPQRRVTVPPPPIDDFTAEVERPVEVEAGGESVEPVLDREQGASTSASARGASSVASTVSLPSRRRGRGLSIRRPNGPMKSITASLPAHLVDRVTALRLDADVEGRSFKLTELFSAALLELPAKPSAIAALVDRYSSQFNYERSARDEGFIEERRLSTQITPDAAKRVAAIVRAVYQDFGVKISNKDLYAVALLSLLADERGSGGVG